MEERTEFRSTDEIKLIGIWNIPFKANSRAVILCHGITVGKEEDGMFTETAKLLAENEIASVRFDFRGHGESGGRPEEMTVEGEIEDLSRVYKEVEKRGFNKIGIVGSSFGGAITVLTAKRLGKDVKAVCLWNPVLNFRETFINPNLPWLKDDILRMREELKEQQWTELPTENRFRIGRKLFEEMKGTEPYRKIKELEMPVLIIHGDKDAYIPYKHSVKYLENFKNPKGLVKIKGSDHGFSGVGEKEYKRQAYQATTDFFRKYL